MSLFKSSKTPTKIFVTPLYYPKVQSKGVMSAEIKTVSKSLTGAVATTITAIAPELIEEGFKALSSTIAGFTEDYTSETLVHKNIDGESSKNIFIPKHINIIRANFSSDINDERELYFGNFGEYDNLSDRKLQIDLDIIKSRDREAFYFQPSRYYYIGKDIKNKQIDEIQLSFAFVLASENIDYATVDFQKIILFKDLEDDYDYNFKIEEKRYDTTYQSPWINIDESKKGAYTIVFKIEEIRHSKPFAKTLNRIYKKHEDELKKKINKEIKEQLSKHNSKEST